MIEYLPPDYKLCRSVLIDFGKGCLQCFINYLWNI